MTVHPTEGMPTVVDAGAVIFVLVLLLLAAVIGHFVSSMTD